MRARPKAILALVLHAHLPFVRHPEHERFLEESWLYEALTEAYLPLLGRLWEWQEERLEARLAISLSPTLGAMLRDGLLRERYERRLAESVELAEQETFRTHWDSALRPLAEHYLARFLQVRETWNACGGDVVAAFRRLEESGRLELLTTAATHGLLPLLARQPPAVRAQVGIAHDTHEDWFGRRPRGFWLPECAYSPEIEPALAEAGVRWTVTESHGLWHARPEARYGVYAPVYTPRGLAVFARDPESAQQVWSRQGGYPGDPRYRDFYRDIGFDLNLDYVRPYLPSPGRRGFTGIKYHRIGQGAGPKEPYDRDAALAAVEEHARHFLDARQAQFERVAPRLDKPPILVAPYDAELFGHWWYEGPEFLDAIVRQAHDRAGSLSLATPGDYLAAHPTHQVAEPSPSTWGEAGFLRVWLNEKNDWILPRVRAAQDALTRLVRRFPAADALTGRALRQAGRELLLAQASDWPFMLSTSNCPEYARARVTSHLHRFKVLADRLDGGTVDAGLLERLEREDNPFPALDHRWWA